MSTIPPATVERDFMEARARLLDLAAYLDRVERCGGGGDFRHLALLGCIPALLEPDHAGRRTRVILDALSDPSGDPIPAAGSGAACGAPRPPTP